MVRHWLLAGLLLLGVAIISAFFVSDSLQGLLSSSVTGVKRRDDDSETDVTSDATTAAPTVDPVRLRAPSRVGTLFLRVTTNDTSAKGIYRNFERMDLSILAEGSDVSDVHLLSVDEKELRDRVRGAKSVILNDQVLRLMCSVHTSHQHDSSKATSWTISLERYTVEHLQARSRLLMQLLVSGADEFGFVAAVVGDIHAFSFGDNGFFGTGSCFKMAGVNKVVSLTMFNSEWGAVIDVLRALKHRIRVHFMPWHVPFRNLANNGIGKSHRERKYDVCAFGSSTKQSYPFRARLFDLIRSQIGRSNLAIAFAEAGSLVSYAPNGTVMQKQEGVWGSALANTLMDCRLTVATGSRTLYVLLKYLEVAEAGSIICGNGSMDLSLLLRDKEFLRVEPYMTDDEIMKHINHWVVQTDWLDHTAQKVRSRFKAALDLSMYGKHVMSALTAKTYSPVPPFLTQWPGEPSVLESIYYGIWPSIHKAFESAANF